MSAGIVSAQTEDEEEETIYELSPFQVDESENLGYFSAQSLAGGRLSTNLSDVATSVQVVTMEFIEDIGATNLDEILAYTTATEAVSTMSDEYFSIQEVGTSGTIDQSQARQDPDAAIRIRGFARPTRTEVSSQAANLQSHFLGGHFISNLGYREDQVTQLRNNQPPRYGDPRQCRHTGAQ